MTDEDRALLMADVKIAEGWRAKAYQDSVGVWTVGLDVTPSLVLDRLVDARHTDSKPMSKCLDPHAALVGASYFSNGIIVQLGNVAASCFSLLSFLKASRIRVNHLLSHRRELKIAHMVIAPVAVEMVDCDSIWNGTNKDGGNKPMHQESLPISATMKRYALGLCAFVLGPLHRPSLTTPEPCQSPNGPAFVDLVPTFVVRNALPHTVNYTIGVGAK